MSDSIELQPVPAIAETQPKPLTPARQELKNALGELQTARSAVEQSGGTLQRAQDACSNAAAVVQSFGDLEHRVVQWRVSALKQGIDSAVLPRDLSEQQLELLHSRKGHEQAVLAHRQVQEEHEAAQKTLLDAQARYESALVGVLAEHVDNVLKHLAEAAQLREHMRILLRGVGIPTFEPTHWVRLSPEQRRTQLLNTLQDAGLPFGSPENWEAIREAVAKALVVDLAPNLFDGEKKAADARARDYWKNFTSSLMADPDAEPGPLPNWDALTYAPVIMSMGRRVG